MPESADKQGQYRTPVKASFQAVVSWLKQANDAFDGLKPIEVIERGEIDRIWSMIFQLRSGNPY